MLILNKNLTLILLENENGLKFLKVYLNIKVIPFTLKSDSTIHNLFIILNKAEDLA